MISINSDSYLGLYIDVLECLKSGCKTRKEIYTQLKNKYTFDDITNILNDLLSTKEMIVRNDFYYKDSEYELLGERIIKSPYTKHYRNFSDDNPNKTKKFLLISDTHIGNKNIENMKLINSIYEYAVEKECEWVFHEGDLFEGKVNNDNEINKFVESYPNFLKTIMLIGNHDERIENIKQLTRYNDNIIVYELPKWTTTLNKIDIHFSHRLYISWLIENKQINDISDICDAEAFELGAGLALFGGIEAGRGCVCENTDLCAGLQRGFRRRRDARAFVNSAEQHFFVARRLHMCTKRLCHIHIVVVLLKIQVRDDIETAVELRPLGLLDLVPEDNVICRRIGENLRDVDDVAALGAVFLRRRIDRSGERFGIVNKLLSALLPEQIVLHFNHKQCRFF